MVKAWREAKLREQGGRCALTHYSIEPGKAVADHCHKTGHMRGVLSRGANSMLGVIENNRARFGLSWPEVFALGRGLEEYVNRDCTGNVLHPLFRTEDEKRLLRNKRAVKARAAKKVAP